MTDILCSMIYMELAALFIVQLVKHTPDSRPRVCGMRAMSSLSCKRNGQLNLPQPLRRFGPHCFVGTNKSFGSQTRDERRGRILSEQNHLWQLG